MIYCMVCALWQTEEKIPDRQTASKDDKYKGFTSIMAGLCGRGKDKFGKEKNTLKELGRVAVHYFLVSVHTCVYINACVCVCAAIGCTTSHLLAMRAAIYSNTTTSRYALILEDDVRHTFIVFHTYKSLSLFRPGKFLKTYILIATK